MIFTMPFSADQTGRFSRHRPDRHSGPLERSVWPRSGRAERDLAGAGLHSRPASGPLRWSAGGSAQRAERCRSLSGHRQFAGSARTAGRRAGRASCRSGMIEASPAGRRAEFHGRRFSLTDAPFARAYAGKRRTPGQQGQKVPTCCRGREMKRAGECYQHSRPVADPRLRRTKPAMTVYPMSRWGRDPHAQI